MTLQTCAPENFRSCRWGAKGEDPHRRERNLSLFHVILMLSYMIASKLLTQDLFTLYCSYLPYIVEPDVENVSVSPDPPKCI